MYLQYIAKKSGNTIVIMLKVIYRKVVKDKPAQRTRFLERDLEFLR